MLEECGDVLIFGDVGYGALEVENVLAVYSSSSWILEVGRQLWWDLLFVHYIAINRH